MIKYQALTAIYGNPQSITGDPPYDMVIHISDEKPAPEQLLGYKLMAGLSIFYVTPEVYEEGLKRGLIETIDRQILRVTLREIRSHMGHMMLEVFPQALRESTVETLAETLRQACERPSRVRIKVYDAWRARRDEVDVNSYPMEELCLDMERRILLSYTAASKEECFEHCYFPIFAHSETYEACVDRLAYKAYMEIQNVRDLFEVYRENDFYDVDRFLQRLYRFAFLWEGEARLDGERKKGHG